MPFPSDGAEARIKTALAGRSGEVLRLIVAQPRKGSDNPPSDIVISVSRFERK